MAENNTKRGPGHGPGGPRGGFRKPKALRGTLSKLMGYLGRYKALLVIVVILLFISAACANPPVLILDEATSSIDTRTERIVQEGMDRLMAGRTVFVIAHRLSTVRNSDCIMVLEQGRIIERGTHSELLAQEGIYRRFIGGREQAVSWKL